MILYLPTAAELLLDKLPEATLARLVSADEGTPRDVLCDRFVVCWDTQDLPLRARLLESLLAEGLRAGLLHPDSPALLRAQRRVEQLQLPLPPRYPTGLHTVRELLRERNYELAQVRLHSLLLQAVDDLCAPDRGPVAARLRRLPVAPELQPGVRDVASMLGEDDGMRWTCYWLARLFTDLCDGGHPHAVVLIGDAAELLQTAIVEL